MDAHRQDVQRLRLRTSGFVADLPLLHSTGQGDSHFFGRGTAECASTGQKNPTFVLEDAAFMHLGLPAAGVCPAGTQPTYRVFSNRHDANHRYMTDRALRDQMVAQGWLAEGDGGDLVVMCAPQQGS